MNKPVQANRTASQSIVPIALVFVLFAGMFLGLVIGEISLSPAEILAGFTGRDSFVHTILWNIRLPRMLVATLVGAALSASGLLMQAYFRNSLASPGLLGVTAGGSVGAVTAIAAGWVSTSILALPAAAIVGAFVSTFSVLVLARRGSGVERLLLAGIALNALLGSIVSYILSSSTLGYERNAQIVFWLLGGLEDRAWEHVWIVAPTLVLALGLWPLGRSLDLLSLGEKEALSLGVDVGRVRGLMLFFSTVLTALATSVAGSIGFVGLIVPHVLRLMLGAEHRRLIPASLIGGAAFVLLCDVAGRFAGGMRIGVVTSLVGAPFFLWLLRRQP